MNEQERKEYNIKDCDNTVKAMLILMNEQIELYFRNKTYDLFSNEEGSIKEKIIAARIDTFRRCLILELLPNPQQMEYIKECIENTRSIKFDFLMNELK